MSDDDWGDEDVQAQVSEPPKYEMAEVLDDYIPEDNNTLTLIKYDLVYVMKKNADGWWEGETKGVYGRFPSSYVKVLKPTDTIVNSAGGNLKATESFLKKK